MKKIINNLRNRPVEHRKHILHITTALFAVLLFVAWVYTLTA